MIVYVDLEHERLGQEPELWQYFAARTLETKYRLEAISGQLCLIVRYHHLSLALLAQLNPRAVIVSGHYYSLHHYDEADLAGLRALFKTAAWPTLGFCGAFQLMAQTYGADIGPIEPAPEAASASLPDTPMPPALANRSLELAEPERKQERGFMPVRILQPHPLFKGLGPQPVVFQLHTWEVKTVPGPFQRLADSELCGVQAIAHARLPLFGTQFHPEQYDEAHPAGRQILENFFQLAGITA